MSDPAEHLPVARLMQFSARLLVVSALNSSSDSAFADLPHITRLSRDVLGAEPDLRAPIALSSGAPVQQLAQAIAAYARKSSGLTTIRRKATARYVAAIESAASRVDCGGCAKSQMCSSAVTQAVVNQNVERDGRCVDAIRATFADASAVAAWFMTTFGAASSPTTAPALRMSTTHTRNPRPHGVDGSSVALSARYVARNQLVTLDVNTDRFDEPTFHVLPYILLHELLCHAWDGAAASKSSQPSDADAFAEGWMDHVALLVHNDWMDRRFSTVPLPPAHTAARKAAAMNFHMQRRAYPDEAGVTHPGRLRSQGAREAEHLLELLGDAALKLGLNGDRARNWLYSLGAYLTKQSPADRLAMAFWHATATDARNIAAFLEKDDGASAWHYARDRIHDLLAT